MRANLMASIFVSYSHLDESWKDRLLRHFKVFEQQGLAVSAWHDRKIPGGGDWDAEIRRAMAEADAAVLLVSTDFLGSEFINEVEVPFLLDRREREGLPVIPVVVLPCNWKMVPWLKKLNLRPRDAAPISAGTEHEIELAFAAIAEEAFRFVAEPSKLPLGPGRSTTRADWHLVHPYGMPPNFTGRLAERNRLSDWLEQKDGPALLILRALGGFGKTALGWHWLSHDVDPTRWPRVVWWGFYDESSFDEFLCETLGYLGVDAQGLGAREGVRRLVGVLQRSNVLLVLDGFERTLRVFAGMDAAYRGDVEEKRPGEGDTDCVSMAAEIFLRDLAALPGLMCRVLLTTRLRPRILETRVGELLGGCQEVELTELGPADAVKFFRAEGVRGTRAEIEAACSQYGFHPLSLRLLAGLILKDLRHPGEVQVAQRLDVSGDLIHRRHHVLEQSYASLPIEERRLLSRIACFRGSVRYEALVAAAGGIPEREVEAASRDLIERGLLHRDERDGHFDLHPIVRRYAYDFLGKEEKEDAHKSLRDYFAAVPPAEKVKTLGDLAPVIELYHHMAQAREFDAACNLFRDRLEEATYYQLGAYEMRIELLRALFPDGEDQPPRLREGNAQGWTLNSLANTYSLSGQPQRAMPLFYQAIAVTESLAEEKRNLVVDLSNLASLQLALGTVLSAETTIRRQIDLCLAMGEKFWGAQGHQILGHLLGIRGQWDQAATELEVALQAFAELEEVQPEGNTWSYLALLLLRVVRVSEATAVAVDARPVAAARRALALAMKALYPHERDYVRAHWLLGTAYRENRDLSESERHLSEALERCRRINLVEHEADILIDLGRLRLAQDDAGEARRLGEEAVAIAERCGYVLQGADAHLLLALLDKEAGNLIPAREHAARARELAACDGPPDYTYKVAYDEAGALLAELG